MTAVAELVRTFNGRPVALTDVPVVPMEVFRDSLRGFMRGIRIGLCMGPIWGSAEMFMS